MKTILEWHLLTESKPDDLSHCLISISPPGECDPYISFGMYSKELGFICEPNNIRDWITYWAYFPKPPTQNK